MKSVRLLIVANEETVPQQTNLNSFTMAKLNSNPPASSSRATSRAHSLYRDPTPTAAHASRMNGTLSPSPSASFSSDKENRENNHNAVSNKGKGRMGPPSLPVSIDDTGRANKRRRLGERDTSTLSPSASRIASRNDADWYDPEQDQDERREIRISLRNNAREIHERQDELVNGDGQEFKEVIKMQTRLFDQVRQTSDAMIDSRTLVAMSETALKRTTRIAHGDGSVGVDIDEFVSKCITFMQYGGPLDDNEEPVSTQARRRRASRVADDDEEDEENDGDALAWDVLGEQACFPSNKRPPVPGFLLGPLSVQKRVRSTQRQSRLRKGPEVPVSKPQQLRAEDLERNETSNLTNLCKGIRERLHRVSLDGAKGVEEEAAERSEDMDESEARAIFNKYGLAMSNWEVSLFRFVVNPHSFAQTVENLFYVSFLVKDGYVQLGKDDDGLPTLTTHDPGNVEERRDKQSSRHQAIFSLNFETWRKLVRAFDIKEPLIPHRDEEHVTQVGNSGWYG